MSTNASTQTTDRDTKWDEYNKSKPKPPGIGVTQKLVECINLTQDDGEEENQIDDSKVR